MPDVFPYATDVEMELATALRQVLAAHCAKSWDGVAGHDGVFCGACTPARRVLAQLASGADECSEGQSVGKG